LVGFFTYRWYWLAALYSWFCRPLYVESQTPVELSGQPYPMARTYIFAVGLVVRTRPISFCRVTSRTCGLTRHAWATL
jgi:hypothetical protein